ncbi:hypothetical protein ABIC16_001365 [Sphingomonas sp. PvP055]
MPLLDQRYHGEGRGYKGKPGDQQGETVNLTLFNANLFPRNQAVPGVFGERM